MDTAIVIALIALVGSLVSTVATVFGAPAFQARRERRRILETHREPLLAASYELQARLHNILCKGFVDAYLVANKAGKKDAATASTLYVFAQFFAWREIIRRDVQFLRFGRDRETRAVAGLLQAVGESFLTDDFGPQFMHRLRILRRAPREDGRMARAVRAGPGNMDEQGRKRLVDLVLKLDPKATRYPFHLDEA